jgi:hypothetical protein
LRSWASDWEGDLKYCSNREAVQQGIHCNQQGGNNRSEPVLKPVVTMGCKWMGGYPTAVVNELLNMVGCVSDLAGRAIILAVVQTHYLVWGVPQEVGDP